MLLTNLFQNLISTNYVVVIERSCFPTEILIERQPIPAKFHNNPFVDSYSAINDYEMKTTSTVVLQYK